VGKLPPEYQGHYGPTLIAFTLYQHHQCRVPQPLILEELRELGVDISAGQVNRILIEHKESFHREQEQVLQVGLSTAEYIHTDDTGAWSQYLESLGITSATAVKLVTEAALLGSAIEGGVSPQLIVLSDGARQFAILVHALCWVHAERSIRRLPGATAQHRQDIAEVTSDLWDYYQELKAYQQQPTAEERERLDRRFDEIFGRRYPHHASLNLALQQFCTYKQELLRVLDAPPVPLHTNAAESDIREYVTRRKISGGTRHNDGRRARDTFTGLKKTCRKLGVSFWQYLLSRCLGDKTVSYLPELIRARAAPQNALSLELVTS
jgi:hypothetical protein